MNVIVDKLTKKFYGKTVVDDVSFEAKEGQIVGLLGPNGAGKTTTLRMIAGYLFPNSGTVTIGKYSSNSNLQAIKRNIGYLPEHNPLYQEMNVVDFLLFIAKLHDIPSYRITARVMDMIRICGLDQEKHKNIKELSKGYRQRVGLAQALIHDPKVILLDEPTSGLDPNQSGELRKLIHSIAESRTIIMSSHILNEIELTCNRVLIMNNGRIVANGTTSELRRANNNEKLLKVSLGRGDIHHLSDILIESDLVRNIEPISSRSIEIHCPNDVNIEEYIFQVCQDKNWYLKELTPIETQLEDIFKEVTNN